MNSKKQFILWLFWYRKSVVRRSFKVTSSFKMFVKLFRKCAGSCSFIGDNIKQVFRNYSAESHDGAGLIYKEYGDPMKVLKKVDHVLSKSTQSHPMEGRVIVKMLAAPINPADINMIQGTYPVKPSLPAVGGNEGVGEVLAVGDDVTSFKEGDWVLPSSPGFGTWRTHMMCKPSQLKLVANDIPLISAATLAVNPCSAYRMLKDFEHVVPGDVIIQNGSNSAVGQAVIQIASAMKFKTINVIRDRDQPDMDALKKHLKSLGATKVITEDFVRKPEMKDLVKSLGKKPKLALNCVGGKSATELARQLENNGTMVTYGGMSKQPVVVPTGSFIFKNIKLRGFWMTRWNQENFKNPESQDMLDELCELVRQCKLHPPFCNLSHIDNFQDAIATAMKPQTNRKELLIMDEKYLDWRYE
ncbi:unnamed protein product [Owenia fusiformis]|uniref:Enoyl-[acyl-carrier-protein] reductase, mitochondrial n=1 Tax=Owenia fusiformis TaxID=6347 RepID=A0A8J1TA10_OWEFU|nr:unnamed protein product [Owenia fusiformis]